MREAHGRLFRVCAASPANRSPSESPATGPPRPRRPHAGTEKGRIMTGMRAIVTTLALVVVAGLCPASAQQPAPAAGKAPAQAAAPAATDGGEVITRGEVEQAGRAQLSKIDEQRQAILDEKLEELIGQKLLAQEAKKRGLSVDDLLKAEVYAKAPEVPDSEVSSFMAQNKAR